ncbi:hypothetical protein GCM10012279_35820 [Micromonospora yangpuensis]|uniref:Uncharacterized protein n=1 Tax=Micromonospora yangpuensis TaxID=683228 RepID=A0A1C6V300_9ACTN|nr:hypothetical protein GCM10012279_35820 [Micromonospora yangpuensis]SCL60608.1 hypothetical protein GA0070617_4427 [Micromonospora yangpuensis]
MAGPSEPGSALHHPEFGDLRNPANAQKLQDHLVATVAASNAAAGTPQEQQFINELLQHKRGYRDAVRFHTGADGLTGANRSILDTSQAAVLSSTGSGQPATQGSSASRPASSATAAQSTTHQR